MDENSFQSVDFTQIHQHPRAVSLNDLDSLNSSNEANRNPRAVSHTLVGTTNTFNEVNHPRTPAGASEASLVVTRPQPLSQSGTSETALDIIRPQSQTPDRAVDIGPISDRSQPTGMSGRRPVQPVAIMTAARAEDISGQILTSPADLHDGDGIHKGTTPRTAPGTFPSHRPFSPISPTFPRSSRDVHPHGPAIPLVAPFRNTVNGKSGLSPTSARSGKFHDALPSLGGILTGSRQSSGGSHRSYHSVVSNTSITRNLTEAGQPDPAPYRLQGPFQPNLQDTSRKTSNDVPQPVPREPSQERVVVNLGHSHVTLGDSVVTVENGKAYIQVSVPNGTPRAEISFPQSQHTARQDSPASESTHARNPMEYEQGRTSSREYDQEPQAPAISSTISQPSSHAAAEHTQVYGTQLVSSNSTLPSQANVLPSQRDVGYQHRPVGEGVATQSSVHHHETGEIRVLSNENRAVAREESLPVLPISAQTQNLQPLQSSATYWNSRTLHIAQTRVPLHFGHAEQPDVYTLPQDPPFWSQPRWPATDHTSNPFQRARGSAMANNQHRAVAGEPTSFLPRTLGHANYPPSLAPPSAFVWQGLTAQEQTYEQGPSYYGPPTHAYTVPSPPAATLGTRQTVHNPSNAVEPGRNQMRRIRQPPMADSSASESDNGRMDPRKYSQPYPSYGESNANSMVRERGRQRPDPRQSFSDHSNSSSPHRRIPQHAPPNPHGVTFAQGGPHGQSPQSNPMTPQGRNRVPARTSFSDEALMRLRRSGGQHANMSLRSRGFSDIQIQLHELGFDPAQFQSDAEISDFLVARGESVPQVQGSSRPHPTHDAVTRYLASLPSLRDRRLALIEKLVASFPAQAATLRKPEARSTLAQDQVLVFVDYSNIKLGLVNCVRVRCSLPRTTLVSGVRMSFVSLAWVMLRGRKLSSGFVGTSKSGHRRSDPGLTEAIGLGFEVLELDRRPLAADESGDLSGAGASSSAPASGPSPARGSRPPRMKERYVDELIQQRMGDAILDASAKFAAGRGPTMVLASGDGNEAEFTAGFVPKLRQALRFGWRVEVLSFRQSLSGRYQELADEFPGLVTIILLDEYMAELLDE